MYRSTYYSECMMWTSQWRHNGRDSVSNHQLHNCFLNRLFRRRSKKTSKLRVTGLCAGNSPGTGEFPGQMASNAENVSIWWRHHDLSAALNNIILSGYHHRCIRCFRRPKENKKHRKFPTHYSDVIMSVMVPQITGLSSVCSIVGWSADHRKQHSSSSLAFLRGIHRSAVNCPHKKPVTRKMFPFDDFIMQHFWIICSNSIIFEYIGTP